MRLSALLLTSCLVSAILSLGMLCSETSARDKKTKKKGEEAAAAAREEMKNKVRKALGDEEEGHFVVVLKKTYYQATKSVRQANGNSYKQVRAPRGRPFAMVSYEVWIKKDREPMVDFVTEHLLKFRPDISGKPPAEQPPRGMPMSTTDFRFIGRYDDVVEATNVQRNAKAVFDKRAQATR